MLTLAQMQNRVGVKGQLVNSSGTFVDGLVTADNVRDFINDRKDELYLKIIEKYPDLNRIEETFDTAEDTSSYAFTELTGNKYLLDYVGIKYSSTADSFTRAIRTNRKNLFPDNTDTDKFSQNCPYYYEDLQSSVAGIEIYPAPTAVVTDGIFARYVPLPTDLAAADDTLDANFPPLLERVVIQYAIADVWETKRDYSNSNQALNRAILLEERFFDNYMPEIMDNTPRVMINATFDPYHKLSNNY